MIVMLLEDISLGWQPKSPPVAHFELVFLEWWGDLKNAVEDCKYLAKKKTLDTL